MKHAIIIMAAVLLVMFIGCTGIEQAQRQKCAENKLELKSVIVELPEMEDFEVISYDRLNENFTIGHKTENTSIFVQINEESDEKFEKTRISLMMEDNRVDISNDGNIITMKVYGDKEDLIGNTRYIYIHRIGKFTAAFTHYDYTKGKWDERVADIVDKIVINPKRRW